MWLSCLTPVEPASRFCGALPLRTWSLVQDCPSLQVSERPASWVHQEPTISCSQDRAETARDTGRANTHIFHDSQRGYAVSPGKLGYCRTATRPKSFVALDPGPCCCPEQRAGCGMQGPLLRAPWSSLAFTVLSTSRGPERSLTAISASALPIRGCM